MAVIDWWYETTSLAEDAFGEGGMGHSAVDELGALYGLRPDLQSTMGKGPVPSYHIYKGAKVYPSPRPVLTYRQQGDVVDLARLTPQKCAAFADGATTILEEMIQTIREGWEEIGKP